MRYCQSIVQRSLFAAVVALAVLGQAGCSSLVQAPLPNYLPSDSDPSLLIDSVPFVAQKSYQCGPAALEMVLSYVALSPGEEALVEWVYSPAQKGSLQPFMVAGIRRSGGVAFEIRGAEALLSELRAGYPVVVLQNLGLSWLPRWHYAVVIGYDSVEGRLLMHSGVKESISVDWARFMSTWQRGKEWGVLALPHGVLPQSVSPEEAFVAIAATEPLGVAREKLILAYQAMLGRWEGEASASLALANLFYQEGEVTEALETLREALKYHAGSAALHNNFAALLLESGELETAHHHARKAVELGGEYLPYALQTLSEIEAKLE